MFRPRRVIIFAAGGGKMIGENRDLNRRRNKLAMNEEST
jgi:hypothetical protein